MKRHATTALASIVLTLGALDLYTALRGVWAAFQLDSPEMRGAYQKLGLESPAVSILKPYSWWALLSALLAVAVGLALASRSRWAFLLSIVAAALTAFLTTYNVMAIVPVQGAILGRPQLCQACPLVVGCLTVIGYLGIAIYLKVGGSREEFAGTARVPA